SADLIDPTAGVSSETLQADKSMAGVRVEPRPAPVVEEPVDEIEVDIAEPEPEPVAIQVVETQRVVEVSPEEAGVTRRQFFNRALNVTFFSFLGIMGINSLAFFWPKLSGGFGSDVDAGSLAEVKSAVFAPNGSILPLFVPEAKAYVVPAPATLSDQYAEKQVETDGLMALFQRCVHLGCRVPWCAPSQGFECPCHGSKYNSIGEYFAGPAPRNLDRFVVEVQDDRFIIKTGSVILTSRAPSLTVNYPQGPSCIGAVSADEEA
ncbi:MAG: Rieske 2Fe-2S domain-containing protein, partial [Actinobacteria bacterium]|nr:Rieske 2Fe-2S domain-containing protein [Actinomycetota bacterium]